MARGYVRAKVNGPTAQRTFPRDAKILIDGDYKIERVTPADQFRHVPHVELLARFAR